MKRIIALVFIGIMLIASNPCGTAWAYSDLYVLGDSLSDQGNFFGTTAYLRSQGVDIPLTPPLEYTDGTTFGRFTNGKNYIDYLAPKLGLTSTSSFEGGNNYAVGGARTYYHPQFGPAGSLLGQYAAYNSTHASADPNALYIVWAGANNLKDILLPPSGTPLDPSVELPRAAMDVGFVIGSLAGIGARNILVPNLPDLGIVPLATGGGAPNADATFLSASYNSILDIILNNFAGINLMRFDTFSFVDDVYYHPGKYGLSNVTGVAYSKFVEPGGTTVSNPDEYFSWDGFHPTSAAHRLLAESIYQTAVPEPSTFLLLGAGLAGLGFLRRRKCT